MSHNYDQEELAKFGALAATWWEANGELKTLHQLNPLRISYITSKTTLNHKKVLDVGCGGGILSESMAKQGASVTGIDMSNAVLTVAKVHQRESGTTVDYRHLSIEALAEDEASLFDVITCLEMLEHVPNPASVIDSCAKLLKPGGHLFLSTINRTLKAYFYAVLGAEYILKLLPKNTHDYAKFIRPSEIRQWANKAGLAINDLQGVSYNPFTEEFKLSDDVSVNYLMHVCKL